MSTDQAHDVLPACGRGGVSYKLAGRTEAIYEVAANALLDGYLGWLSPPFLITKAPPLLLILTVGVL